MDIFDKIDEFESKVSDQIKDKLSLFTKIMTDTDMYEKLILNQGNNEEVTPDAGTKDLVDEIKSDKKVQELVYEKCKSYGKVENKKEVLVNKGQKSNKRKKFDSKVYASNLSVSQYINYFDQKIINKTSKSCQFYNKESECGLISELLREALIARLKKKVFIAANEAKQISKNQIFSYKNDKDQSFNKQDVSRQSETEQERINKIIDGSVERLFPKQRPKEDYLSDTFFVNKINECRNEGSLNSKIDVERLIEDLKINVINNYEGDIKENLKLTDDIITNYYNNKFLIQQLKERQNKRSIIEAKDMNFQRGDINFSPNLLLKTKCKLYVRVNRDKSDLVIRGNQVAV